MSVVIVFENLLIMTRKHFLFLFILSILLSCASCTKEELSEDSLCGDWVVESSNETVAGFWGYSTFMKGDMVHFDQSGRVIITRPVALNDSQTVFDFGYRINNHLENESHLEILVSQYYAVDQTGLVSFFISKHSRSSLFMNKIYDRQISDEVVILKRAL